MPKVEAMRVKKKKKKRRDEVCVERG